MELDVGGLEAGAGAEETGGLGDVGTQRTAPLLQQREVLRRGRTEQRLLVGEVVEVDHRVVLEVLPDRQRLPDLDPERRELVLGSDPREHQQDRRLVGAGGHDHLTLGAQLLQLRVAEDLDAGGPPGVEQDPGGHRARDHVEVRTVNRRAQERVRGALALAVALGQLEAAHALLAGAVEVRVVLVAGPAGRLDHRVDEWGHRAAL